MFLLNIERVILLQQIGYESFTTQHCYANYPPTSFKHDAKNILGTVFPVILMNLRQHACED